MNKEESELLLAEIRQKRTKIVENAIKEEMSYWVAKHEEDRYFLEKELIKLICSELKILKNLGSNLTVSLFLENTSFSGEKFINFEKLQKVMKNAGIFVKINSPSSQLTIDISNNLPLPDYMVNSIDIPDDTLERLLEQGDNDWFISLVGAYLNYKKSPKGMEETENEIAMNLYDELTNAWRNMMNSCLLTDSAPFVNLECYYPKHVREYANFTRVLEKLKAISSEFEINLVNGRSIDNEMFTLYIKEKDYILDEKTGIAKSFVLDGAIK